MSEVRKCDYCGREIGRDVHYYRINRHWTGVTVPGIALTLPPWPKDACGDCWNVPTVKSEVAA